MKVKGCKQIDNSLSKWLRKEGFPLKAMMHNDFMYIAPSNLITYSFLVPIEHDELYLEVCKQLAPELKCCDTFILSFFHELGHYMTEEMFNDEEYFEYLNTLEKLESKENLTKEEYLQYYMSDIERVATEWGLNYILTHPKKIKKFGQRIYKLQRKFLKKNNFINT